MSKIEIGLAVGVAELKLKPTSQALNAFETELRERAEANKKPKDASVKKQYIFVPYPIDKLLSDAFDKSGTAEEQFARTAQATDKTQSGWVLQVPDGDNLADLWERVHRAVSNFNNSPKGRKIPVKTVAEAFEFVPARFWKEQKIWIKTKDVISKVNVPFGFNFGKVEK